MKPAGESHSGEPGLRVICQRAPRAASRGQHGESDRGIARLERAHQRRGETAGAPAHIEALIEREARARHREFDVANQPVAASGEDRRGTRRHRLRDQKIADIATGLADDRGHFALEDTCLLHRDQFERVPQILHVVKPDLRDTSGERAHNVGGVQSPTQPHFDDGDIGARVREMCECHRGRGLEKCRAEPSQQRLVFVEPRRNHRLRHRTPVDDNALVEVDEMRRSVPRHAKPGVTKQRIEGRDRAALAICTRDMKDGIRGLGIAKFRQQLGDAFETESPRAAGTREQPRECCVVGRQFSCA